MGTAARVGAATREEGEEDAGWARPGPRAGSGRAWRARKRGGARERGKERGGEARGGGDGGGARPVPARGGGRGPRGLERASGALPSSGSRPPRRANAGMASRARGPQAAPAQPCDAALSGAPRAAGGSLKDARHRPQIPSDWCKVDGGEDPSPHRQGLCRGAGAWRSAAAEPTCPPWSAARAPRRPGPPDCGGGDWARFRQGSRRNSAAPAGEEARPELPDPRASRNPLVRVPERGDSSGSQPLARGGL